MFTGIIEETGIIKSVQRDNKLNRLAIGANKVLEDVKIGDSINTNGVCLTVTSFDQGVFYTDVMVETLRRTNIAHLIPGDHVNLERAMKLSDRFGGHIVSGHIDGVGTIKSVLQEGETWWYTIAAEPGILKYIIYKGSVALDGISLTVADVDDKFFRISIIPHTLVATTLMQKTQGDKINIECDIVGKYIEKLMGIGETENKQETKKDIDMDLLRNSGFIKY